MANQDDDAKKPKIPVLSQTNCHVWYAAVCDELYAIDAELLFEKAALDADNAEQRGNVDAADVDLPTRKKAFIMIQRSLSQEIKAKLHDVGRGEVETLLRRTRLSFYRPSPHMVEMLHDKISTMVVDSFPNLDAYTLEFQQTARHMVSCGGTVNDTLIRMWYLKGLPSDYAMVKFTITANNTALADTYTAVAAYAATDPKLPGSTHPAARKQGRRDRASAASEQPPKTSELCKRFAETGYCPYGDKCKWVHVKKPDAAPSSDKGSKAPKATAEDGAVECSHCKKVGNYNRTPHSTEKCLRKDYYCEICKVKGKHSTSHCPTKRPKADKAAVASEHNAQYGAVDVADYDVALTANENTLPDTSGQTTFKLLVDGGANCAIFTSTAGMTNLRPASIDIKVGGGSVHCSQIGDFKGTILTDAGVAIDVTLKDGRICPAFGQSIVPESRFTTAGYSISKTGSICTFTRANAKFSAAKSRDGLFYFTVKPATAAAPAHANAHSTALAVSDATNTTLNANSPLFNDAGTAELCSCCGAVDHAYIARAYDTCGSELKLKHDRYGHRFMADVARAEGLTLPPKPFFCRTCIEGKSARLSLNKRRVEPLYTAPRPAYAWHTDVAGPFSVRTPEGHNQFRLLVCGHSRLRKGELISTTADFHIAWEQHVAAVETDLGRTSIVAQLISDSASYYDSDALDQYNLKRVLPISTRLPTLRG